MQGLWPILAGFCPKVDSNFCNFRQVGHNFAGDLYTHYA